MYGGDSVRRLLAIGAAMSAERDLDRLLEMILLSAKELAGADGCTLFLATDGSKRRSCTPARWAMRWAAPRAARSTFRRFPSSIAGWRPPPARDGATIVVDDVYADDALDFVGSRRFDAENGYRTRSLLCAPMRNLAGERVGVIQLINAIDPATGTAGSFSADAVMLAESLASQGAVSIDNRRLIDQLGELFEAFVDTINTAVDERSPYTGNHCKRVPELTMMLADAAVAQRRWHTAVGDERPLLTDDEIENPTIVAGTLTAAERSVANHHIVATIRMLEALPWPKHLRRVPEFAGGHHERVDGKGYPRGLTGKQMPIPAPIVTIADIFEALTAGDRPYKAAKPLSESLHILGKLRLNGHIDPVLFDLFVRQKIYRRYAERFLPSEQIGDIDETAIPGYEP